MSPFIKEQFKDINLNSLQQVFRYFSACPKNRSHADTLSNTGETNVFDAKGCLTKKTSDGRGGMVFDETGCKIHQWAPGLRCE